MDRHDSRIRAENLLQEALREQGSEHYAAAEELYKKSIEEHPTAEAYTFLGWTYSFMGRLDDAIAQCRQAIAVDPAFGNPYNDIGSYLMKQGKMDEAIGWLERAKAAPRYQPRHFPYLNLARIYLATGKFEQASREFAQAQFLHQEIVHGGRGESERSQDTLN